MKGQDFKTLGDTELVKTLSEKREALRVFRFASAGSKTKNVKEGLGHRRSIAKILTELRARELKNA